MADKGLQVIRDLIEKYNVSNSIKPAFDKVVGDYRSSVPQYRAAAVSDKNLIKVSRLSKNINDYRYSYMLNKIVKKYDKKV